jgi:8-oxo-dGTP pyrophosphatase MutT (NUDIX family)
MGRALFFILWPLVWVYAPLSRRVRVVILHGDTFVAVKNSFGPGIWQLPGGGIKMGESVQDAAKREISEELDIDLEQVMEMHSDVMVVRQFGLLMRYHFVFTNIKDELILHGNRELSSVSWLPTSTTLRVATEVKVGLKLARQQR